MFIDGLIDHARNLGFILRSTNPFPAGWYNDHICVFKRSLWVVAQRKDIRAGLQEEIKICFIVSFSRKKL